MRMVLAGLTFAGLVPLVLAWRANRATSLAHALLWAIGAWLSWGVAFVCGNVDEAGMDAGRYGALCLTGCAGVAVLGARRPHVGAWNFVVLGLFAVMVLPLVEARVLGTNPAEDWLRIFFLTMTLAVGILDYLPTRLAPAVLVLLPACAGEVMLLYVPAWFAWRGMVLGFHGLLLAVPWLAWMCLGRQGKTHTEFDRLWLQFRDRWGLLWSQRVREQFNQAAHHAGWPVQLSWRGAVLVGNGRRLTELEEEKMLQTLRAVLQRFLAVKPGE